MQPCAGIPAILVFFSFLVFWFFLRMAARFATLCVERWSSLVSRRERTA